MLVQDHGVVPVEPAEGVSGVGVDAHFVEHIGTDLDFSGFTAQQADTFVKVHLHLIVLGPVLDGPLHGNAVGDVAEGTVKFIFLFRCENVAIDFDIH